MEIPSEIFINGTVEQGAIYYFSEESIQSEKPHYFVVLNVDPKRDAILVLVCGTSKVKEAFLRRRNMPKETVIEVSTDECGCLRCNTAFDCNRPIYQSLSNLIDKNSRGLLKYKGQLAKTVLDRLIKGVVASPMVERKHKNIVTNS